MIPMSVPEVQRANLGNTVLQVRFFIVFIIITIIIIIIIIIIDAHDDTHVGARDLARQPGQHGPAGARGWV